MKFPCRFPLFPVALSGRIPTRSRGSRAVAGPSSWRQGRRRRSPRTQRGPLMSPWGCRGSVHCRVSLQIGDHLNLPDAQPNLERPLQFVIGSPNKWDPDIFRAHLPLSHLLRFCQTSSIWNRIDHLGIVKLKQKVHPPAVPHTRWNT